jgi:hypothetical protein
VSKSTKDINRRHEPNTPAIVVDAGGGSGIVLVEPKKQHFSQQNACSTLSLLIVGLQ